MKLVTSDFYTELAPVYQEYACKRANYLAAIDKLVLKTLDGDSILDVGAGDGLRSFEISKMKGIDKIIFVEPNKAMAALAKENTGLNVCETSAERLWGVMGKYDNVFCLYNVLGHVPSEDSRVVALRNMGNKLADGGSIYLDVNNRNNVSAYGWKTVGRNKVLDKFSRDNSHGDVSFQIDVGGKKINGSGHVFSSKEMEDLIGEAGLSVRRKCFVNYDSGRKALTQFGGQMFLSWVMIS